MKQKFRNQVIIWILVAVFLSETAMESMAAGRAVLSAPYAVSEVAVKHTAGMAAESSLEGAVETEPSEEETVKAENSKEETTKSETSREETAKTEISKEETTKVETSKEETTKVETSEEETTEAETSTEETKEPESAQEDPSKEGNVEETVGKGTDSNGTPPLATGSEPEKNTDQPEPKGMLRQLWDRVLTALENFFNLWKKTDDNETKYSFNFEERIVDKLTMFIDALRHPENVFLRPGIATGSEATGSEAIQYLEDELKQWEEERRQEESIEEEKLILDEGLLQPEVPSQTGELLQDEEQTSDSPEAAGLEPATAYVEDGDEETAAAEALQNEEDGTAATDSTALKSGFFRSARAAGGNVLTGNQSGDGLTLSGDYTLENFSYTANPSKSAITVAKGTTLTLYIKGTVTLTGGDGNLFGDALFINFTYGGGAGIEVPQGSTLIVLGDRGAVLNVQGGKTAKAQASKVFLEPLWRSYTGGSGGGAGIGGRGGNGGKAWDDENPGGDGFPSSTGKIYILSPITVNARGGDTDWGNEGDKGGDGGVMPAGSIGMAIPTHGGRGGSGGGGNGGPGAGIGGGGVGGGGTSRGGNWAWASSIGGIYDTSVGGSGGSGGGGGYSSDGGGGGGGGVATYVSFGLGYLAQNTKGAPGGEPGEDGSRADHKEGSEGGWGGKAGHDGKGGEGGYGGKGNYSNKYHADGFSGGKGGDAGTYSTVEDIIICKDAVVNATAGYDPCPGGPLKGGQIDGIGQGGSPSYRRMGTIKNGYWLDQYDITLSQDSYDYDGSYHRPDVLMDEEMRKGCEISYADNQNAGTGLVKVTGKEDTSGLIPYVKGSKTLSFRIKKADMTPPPVIQTGSSQVVLGDSLAVSVAGNIAEAKVTFNVVQGEGTVENVVNGMSNIKTGAIGKMTVKAAFAESRNYLRYECTAQVDVLPRPISQCYIAPIPDQAYTGSPISPDLEISYGGKVLKKGVDYEAQYQDNTDKGTAAIVLTGKGDFTDAATTYFTISTASISGAAVSTIGDVTYNGKAFTPEPEVSFGGNKLDNGLDYILSYENNVVVGTASVHIIGQGGYTGEQTVTFQIKPCDLAGAVPDAIPDDIFNGTEIKKHPEFRIKLDGDDDQTLLYENTDYTLDYADNLLAGTATVTARGTGNYTGTKEVSFQINKRQLTVVPEKGMTKEKDDPDPGDLGTRYTFTNGISGFTPVFEGSLERDPGETTGNYQIREGTLQLTGNRVNDNYSWTLATEYFGIVEPADIISKIILSGTQNPDTGWYITPVSITNERNLDMSFSNSMADTNTWGKQLSYPDGDYHKVGITCYLRENGRVSKPQYVQFKQDTGAPTGSILIGTHSWNSFLNSVTFGYFFKDTVEVKILGSDYVSGIDKILYMTSTTALTEDQVKSQPDSAWTEGDHFTTTDPKVIVYAKLQDKAGWTTYLSTEGIIYDKDKPVLEAVYPYEDTWTSEAGAAIDISVEDAGSGLRERYITYQIGSEAMQTLEIAADGTVTKTLEDLPDGDYSVWINASDNAGNVSDTREVRVKKDTTPPEVTLNTSGSWENQDVEVTVHAEDESSPITAWKYSLDGGTTWSSEAAYGDTDPSFTVEADGVYDQIQVLVRNAAGLETTTAPGDFVIRRDTKKPEVSLVITDFGYHDATDNNRWYRDSAPLLSFDADYTSQEAPVQVYWKIWKEGTTEPADWKNVGEDAYPAVSGEGVYQVTYYGEDEAGNRSDTKTETVRYDNVAPSFGTPAYTLAVTGDSALEKFGNLLTFGNFFKEGVTVTIHGEDRESGLETVSYTVNGGEEKTVSQNSFLIENGTSGRIVLKLADKAGNVSTQVLQKDGEADEWMVEDKPPVIDPLTTRSGGQTTGEDAGDTEVATSADAARLLPNKEGWYRSNVVVSTNISDGDSGLNNVTGTYSTEEGVAGTIDQRFSGDRKQRDYQYSQELSEEGKNTIYLRAEDNAGNSTDISQDFYIDKTEPAIELTSDYTDPSQAYVNKAIQVKLAAKDQVSGLARLSYTVDGGISWETKEYPEGTASDGPIEIQLEDGSYGKDTVRVTVWDRAGNEATAGLDIEVIQDTKAAPEAVLTVTPGAGGAYDKVRGWYTGPRPTISLTLEEAKAGEVANYGYWKLWNETAGESDPMGTPSEASPDPASWSDPQKQGWSCIHEYGVWTEAGVVMKRDLPFITDEGIYRLKYYTIDAIGNSDDKDNPHEAVIRWDNSRPEYASPSYAVAKVDNTPIEDVGRALSFGNFYKDRVQVSVDVDDAVSGLESLTYTVNDGKPKPIDLTDPRFTLPLGTSGTVYVTAVDQAGLSSQLSILGKDSADMWYLETNKPVIGDITTTVQPSQWGWYNQDLPLQSTVLDEDSGLETVEWTIGTDPDKQKTERFSQTSIQHTYHFSQTLEEEGKDVEIAIGAADLAGNISDPVKKTFCLDKEKPVIKSLQVKTPADYQAGAWTNSVVTVEAVVEDSLSGIAKASYTIDGGKTWIETVYPADAAAGSQTITFDLPDGVYPEDQKRVQVKAWDFADNEIDNVSQGLLLPTVRQDTAKPPEPELTVSTRGRYNQDTKWYAGPAPELSLSVKERGADETENQVYWKLWNTDKGESEPAEWSTGVPVIQDDPSVNGRYILKYFAQDAVKNASEIRSADIWWDNTIPVYEEPPFTYEQEDGGIWSDIGNFLTFGNYFKKGIRVTVHTHDELSGLQKIAYSINSGAYQSVPLTGDGAGRFLIPENTVGQVMIEVTDQADNIAARLVLGSKDGSEWVLEGTAPVIGDVTTDSIPSEYGWFADDITLTGLVTDRDSGLKTIRHKLGSLEEVVEEMKDQSPDTKAAEYEYREILSEEGEITLSLSAEDNALNQSSGTFTFRLDKTEPENVRMKVVSPTGLASGAFANTDLIIEVSADDTAPNGGKASGVKRFAYSIDNGKTWAEQPYDPADGSKNRFTIMEDGFYDENREDIILLKVWDGAGNCHETKAEGDELIRAGRDTIAPPHAYLTITPDATGKSQNTSGRVWYNGEAAPKISLTVATASEAESPNHVRWTLNPEGSVPPVTDDWGWDGEPKLPDKGAYTLKYYTEDEAGNVTDKASPVTVPVRYDPDPPVYEGFTFRKKGGGLIGQIGSFLGFGNFFKEEVEVMINVSDSLSGLSRLTYSIDGSTAKEIADLDHPSFTIPVGTTGKIELEAVDHAGNRAETVVLGASGNDQWQLETTPPVIGEITPSSPSNADGWYRQDVPMSAAVSDGESGLYQVEAELGSKSDSRPMNPPAASPSSAVKEYRYEGVLEGEGADLKVTVKATDNALNQSERSASFKIDRTKPEISITPGKGFPTEKTGEQPTVEFDVTDGLSGVRESSIEVKKDGIPLAVTTSPIADGYHCTVTLDGNGTYTIDAEDIAGNPASTYTEEEILIDTGSPEAAEVSISPANPDGKNGWYVTIPKIHISIPAQAGVADITTYYTVTLSGQPEGTPSVYDPERPESGPEIPESGVWEVHVWRENQFHVRSGTEFRTVLKVETLFPKNLSITGMPEICVNINVTLTAHAEATGLTRLERWRHSLDGKKSWSGWRDWKQDEENQFEITTDVTKEDAVLFEVEDYAGNSTASNAVKVWRDTVAPVLTPASPSNAAAEVPVSTKLEMDVSEPVSKGTGGSVQVYNMQTAALWCEVPIASDRIEIREKKLTVTLPYALEADTSYYVQVPKGLVKDVAGNENLVMGGRKEWQFRTTLTEPELEVGGYDIQTFSKEDGKEYTAWMKAVQYDSAGKVYQAVVRGAYEDDDGKLGAKLHVEPMYTGKMGEISVATLNTDVVTEVNQNGSFEVWIPEGSGAAELIVSSDETELGRLRLALIGAEFSAEADGILNPVVIEPEVLNSVDLYQDVADPNVSSVKFELRTEEREEDRTAYPETGDPALEELVGVNLPRGTTQIKLLDMGITKTTVHGDGTEIQETMTKLDNPITISLDMPEEFVNYKYLNMVRVHKGDMDFIPVTLSGDKTRGTIVTDRFSDYAILGSNMPPGGSSSHGGGGSRVTKNVTIKETSYQDRVIVEDRANVESETEAEEVGGTVGTPAGQDDQAIHERTGFQAINSDNAAVSTNPDNDDIQDKNQEEIEGDLKGSVIYFPVFLLGLLLAIAAYIIGRKQRKRAQEGDRHRNEENRHNR